MVFVWVAVSVLVRLADVALGARAPTVPAAQRWAARGALTPLARVEVCAPTPVASGSFWVGVFLRA